jgi:hypothetical protein
MVHDDISNTDGMLTHMLIHIGGNKEYIFQPRGLNPKTGQPIDKIWLHEERISKGQFYELDVPMDILGTPAEDIATGFKGRITTLVYHINGCLHVNIKPEGVLKETGGTINEQEFDIRRVKGKMIKPLAGKKLEESKKTTPSPMSLPDRIR